MTTKTTQPEPRYLLELTKADLHFLDELLMWVASDEGHVPGLTDYSRVTTVRAALNPVLMHALTQETDQ